MAGIQGRARCDAARRALALLVLALLVIVGVHAAPASADETTSPEDELARRYAPVMMLQEHPEVCSNDGERFGPMSVEAVLGDPQVALRQLGPGDPVVKWGPTARDLFGRGEGFHLDFPGLALDPGCLYERDYLRLETGRDPTIYAHIVVQPDLPDRLVLQYWFYWYYNDWNDKHESDWEGIQIVFPASSVAEALRVEPIEVGYSQHQGGERSGWHDPKLEREGMRPVVYSSAGSHASFFGSALYLGRSAGQGFGCDDTGGPTVRVDPDVVVLPDSVDDPDSEFAWLAFGGRWGERGEGPDNGPTGPAAKDRWLRPIDRQESLRRESVVVPAGDASGATIAGVFCGAVTFGSNQFVAIELTPARGVALAAIAAVLVVVAARRTSWRRVDVVPVRARRELGETLRSSIEMFRVAPWAFIGLGLISIPLSLVAGVMAGLIRRIPLIRAITELVDAGTDGVGGLVLSLTVAGLVNLIGLVVVFAAVASIMDEVGAGQRPSLAAAFGALGRRWGVLWRTLARATLQIIALMLSVVGIPFGLRQLVRYQFVPQVVMLEGVDGAAALTRSSERVRHRWWYTAFVVALVGAGRVVIASLIGLAILVVVQPPFWILSITVVWVDVLLIPLAAIVLTFVWGDAATRAVDVNLPPVGHDDPELAAL